MKPLSDQEQARLARLDADINDLSPEEEQERAALSERAFAFEVPLPFEDAWKGATLTVYRVNGEAIAAPSAREAACRLAYHRVYDVGALTLDNAGPHWVIYKGDPGHTFRVCAYY